MGTLNVNKTHSWDKHKYSKISLEWTNPSGEQTGAVSLVMGSGIAEVITPPLIDRQIDKKKKGKITNNTSQTITYTLSN